MADFPTVPPHRPDFNDGSAAVSDAEADQDVAAAEEPAVVIAPLTAPSEGVPDITADAQGLAEAVTALAAGTGPVAVDAERASGYRYGQRAYLVQLRREGAGSWLIDPIAVPDLSPVNAALADAQWVLHAATQDIPCLAEVGMRPTSLFDTELGARLAGRPKVGLAAVLEHYLGVSLAKEHSAVDWSTRPLPAPWLLYAALDVELLVELRDAVAADLSEQGKTEWAEQEFAFEAQFSTAGPPLDPWRRTSGMHKVRSRRIAAHVRSLWTARDLIARQRDIAPGRVLPDATLIDLAVRQPRTSSGLVSDRTVESGRSRQRRASQGITRYQRQWLDAISAANALPEDELPELARRNDSPPAARVWADKDPVAAARLAQVRAELADLSESVRVPIENLMTPETLRRVLWKPPEVHDADSVDAAFAGHGARPWQRDLVTPLVVNALHEIPDAD